MKLDGCFFPVAFHRELRSLGAMFTKHRLDPYSGIAGDHIKKKLNFSALYLMMNS
jgi:hypothetical protein